MFPESVMPEQPAPRLKNRLRWLSLSVVLLGATAVGVVAWQQVKPVVDARRYASVTDEVPKAPRLEATAGETLYRIDPTGSSLTYDIQESIVGREATTATGTTHGIAGDLAINTNDLAESRVGKIVVNVEQSLPIAQLSRTTPGVNACASHCERPRGLPAVRRSAAAR